MKSLAGQKLGNWLIYPQIENLQNVDGFLLQKSNGRKKAHLVTKGFTQNSRNCYFKETFLSVARLKTVQIDHGLESQLVIWNTNTPQMDTTSHKSSSH